MVSILQNSVVALILLFLHYFVGLWKLKGGVLSGTYSGIGKRVEEAKGGSTGLKVVQPKNIDNEDEWKDNCNNIIIYQMDKHWFMYEFDHEDA